MKVAMARAWLNSRARKRHRVHLHGEGLGGQERPTTGHRKDHSEPGQGGVAQPNGADHELWCEQRDGERSCPGPSRCPVDQRGIEVGLVDGHETAEQNQDGQR